MVKRLLWVILTQPIWTCIKRWSISTLSFYNSLPNQPILPRFKSWFPWFLDIPICFLWFLNKKLNKHFGVLCYYIFFLLFFSSAWARKEEVAKSWRWPVKTGKEATRYQVMIILMCVPVGQSQIGSELTRVFEFYKLTYVISFVLHVNNIEFGRIFAETNFCLMLIWGLHYRTWRNKISAIWPDTKQI